MLARIVSSLLALSFTGCLINSVADLESQGKAVTVVPETERPTECKLLGRIQGTSHADEEKLARQGAENDFRNKAGELKANYAVIEREGGGRKGTSSQVEAVVTGRAYFCQTLEMQEAEEAKRMKAIEEKEAEEERLKAEEEQREAEEKAEKEAKEAEKKAKKDQD